ncbi:bifunctional metallophosphatase/5'-nucleotidase [Robiginitalea sp. IMCC43444]|uniref:bifunctional metallophosphatase/5'-nucleotidase n=1 Tax=Robiginitalea sp. IMCC43444 TaxID=3459121 RepID=UPI004041233F
MRRRKFLADAATGTLALGIPSLALHSCNLKASRKITLLHTNDVHSHIDPFPADHGRFPNLGGVARRASLIEQVRTENPNTLLLDAGDIFQGTPYFNFYGGELEFRLMNRMGYHAATLGNHDFDAGLQGLLAQIPKAKFAFLSANYDFKNTILDGYIKPATTFSVADIKIGVFGLGIAFEGLVTPDLYGETVYLDPFEMALDHARKLREEDGCELVICLSHLGYRYREADRPSDILLAQRTENIDVIIGGHTHTFMEQAEVQTNRKGEQVLISQVGCYGIRLGRIDFEFLPDGTRSANGHSIVV